MIPCIVQAFESNREDIRRLDRMPLFERTPEVSKIPEVVQTLWRRKGKRLRSHWVYWFGTLAGAERETLDLYAWIVEAIHTATLLHDDVVDVANERRGGPSANFLYGNGAAVLSGDYFLSDALSRLAQHGDVRLLIELCQALKSLSSGELLQRDLLGQDPLTEAPFVEVSHLKTSALFEWAARVGPTLTHRDYVPAVRTFARAFGELFQFSDDVLDLKGGDGKDAWSDLNEGRLNRASWWLARLSPAFHAPLHEAFQRGAPIEPAIVQGKRSYADVKIRRQLDEKLAACRHSAECALSALPKHGIRDALAGLLSLVVERVS